MRKITKDETADVHVGISQNDQSLPSYKGVILQLPKRGHASFVYRVCVRCTADELTLLVGKKFKTPRRVVKNITLPHTVVEFGDGGTWFEYESGSLSLRQDLVTSDNRSVWWPAASIKPDRS